MSTEKPNTQPNSAPTALDHLSNFQQGFLSILQRRIPSIDGIPTATSMEELDCWVKDPKDFSLQAARMEGVMRGVNYTRAQIDTAFAEMLKLLKEQQS